MRVKGSRVRAGWIVSLVFLSTAVAFGSGQGTPTVSPTIAREPLSISLSSGGVPVTALWAEARSAFYVTDGKTRVDLVSAPTERQDGDWTELTYQTADGRTATVKVGPADEGACQVRFSITGEGLFEKLGATFRVGADEGFYGLMERVVQGSQGESWTPGMTEGFDLRGQSVDLYVPFPRWRSTLRSTSPQPGTACTWRATGPEPIGSGSR